MPTSAIWWRGWTREPPRRTDGKRIPRTVFSRHQGDDMAINRARLRQLIEAPGLLALPGVFDGFSTRLVEHAGFEAAFITGSGVSESRLGQPDVGIMGLEENVAAVRAMASCSRLDRKSTRLNSSH